MSIVDIDLSRFDYANPKILEELYLETPINVPDENEFFNLPLNEDYKNNKERIERDLKYKEEKEANESRKRSDTKVENEILNWSDISVDNLDKIDDLVQQLSSNVMVHNSR